jgi:hypothetical protein
MDEAYELGAPKRSRRPLDDDRSGGDEEADEPQAIG